MDITIRRIHKSEIESLSHIVGDVIKSISYYNEIAIKNEICKYSPEELNKKLEADPDSILIALLHNEIVGFCLSKQDDMLIWIEWFGVVESERNKGIAKDLVKKMELTVSQRNAHKIWCDCRTDNVKSKNLLVSMGYSEICTIRNHWYGQDFILWQKEFLNL